MSFAIKGGGSLEYNHIFLIFFEIHLKLLRQSKRVLHRVWDFHPAYIVVEVTMAMTEYGSQRSDQPENVSFEPIIRGLKSDIFEV